MSLFRMDPGPCPVCGAPHTTCTASSEPPMTLLLPNRDAAAVASTPPPGVPPLQAGEFTTATYRRALHGRRVKGTPEPGSPGAGR